MLAVPSASTVAVLLAWSGRAGERRPAMEPLILLGGVIAAVILVLMAIEPWRG